MPGQEDRMTHRVFRAVQLGLVIASILLLGACEEGPGANPENSNNITRTFTVRASQLQIADISSAGVSVGVAIAEYSFPEITSEVVSRGLVHAHIQSNQPGDEAWTALPFSMTVGISTTITIDITYAYTTGEGEFRDLFERVSEPSASRTVCCGRLEDARGDGSVECERPDNKAWSASPLARLRGSGVRVLGVPGRYGNGGSLGIAWR